jgi:hypothetical protein
MPTATRSPGFVKVCFKVCFHKMNLYRYEAGLGAMLPPIESVFGGAVRVEFSLPIDL